MTCALVGLLVAPFVLLPLLAVLKVLAGGLLSLGELVRTLTRRQRDLLAGMVVAG